MDRHGLKLKMKGAWRRWSCSVVQHVVRMPLESTEISFHDQSLFLPTACERAKCVCIHTCAGVRVCVHIQACVCVGRVIRLLPTAVHSVSLAVVRKHI